MKKVIFDSWTKMAQNRPFSTKMVSAFFAPPPLEDSGERFGGLMFLKIFGIKMGRDLGGKK